MRRHCLKFHTISSFGRILQRHFFYSTCVKTITQGSIPAGPNSLSSLENFLVGSLGFSEKQALSISTKLTKYRQSGGATKVSELNVLRNAELVISFLQQKGFTKPQIKIVVYREPRFLKSKIEQTLEPKMKFFQELGLCGSDFTDFLTTQPGILAYGLHSTIHPAIEALRRVMGNNENAVRVMKRMKLYDFNMSIKHLVSNVSLLQSWGIPILYVQKRILQHHQYSPFFWRPVVFKCIITRIEGKWGVSPSSSMFLYAVHVMCSLSEKNIESKCQVFESFGWDRSHVVDLFRKNPTCLAVSEEKIKAVLGFFMNELGYDPGYIVAHHALLNYSLEKRVLPRHLVFQLLKDKGLIREDLSVYTAIKITESQFLKRFIQPFENDVPNLYDIYLNSIGSCAQWQIKGERTPMSQESD